MILFCRWSYQLLVYTNRHSRHFFIQLKFSVCLASLSMFTCYIYIVYVQSGENHYFLILNNFRGGFDDSYRRISEASVENTSNPEALICWWQWKIWEKERDLDFSCKFFQKKKSFWESHFNGVFNSKMLEF